MHTQTAVRPNVLSASTMIGDGVRNQEGENLGDIEEFMIDLNRGCISYAVLSFGGVAGLGDKLFAIPWDQLTLSTEEHEFILDVDKETLKGAPGFDQDDWPDTTSPDWDMDVRQYWESY
jgi:sporulation protein YlmC with PRC-barrel domain